MSVSTSTERDVRSAMPPQGNASPRVTLAVGRVGVVFGWASFLQALPTFFRQSDAIDPGWSLLGMTALVATLVAGVVVSILRRGFVFVQTGLAVAVVLSLGMWPLAVDPDRIGPEAPWIAVLIPAAVGATTVAGSLGSGIVAALVTTSLLLAIRLGPFGGGARPIDVAIDTSLTVAVSMSIVVVGWTLIRQARNDDAERERALRGFREVTRREARESERSRIDALVHDTVLTTLVGAARADTAESREVVSRLATDSIARLAAASSVVNADPADVSVDAFAARLLAVASRFRPFVRAESRVHSDAQLPEPVARALHDATVQAIVNSVQHAGEASRWVTIETVGAGVRVTVADDGRGFDPAEVARTRLGIRVSIRDRVVGVGGSAVVESTSGKGTTVVLEWGTE